MKFRAIAKERQVVDLLIDKGMKIAFAESCTAGKAVARLVNIPDASKVLDVSVVTYANEAKIKYCNVKPETINKYGVVSEEVVKEMAEGIAKNNNAEVGVGISGIAGPTGGTDDKPVGMVCFGIYCEGELYSWTEVFNEYSRNDVRRLSVEYIYDKLIEVLEK